MKNNQKTNQSKFKRPATLACAALVGATVAFVPWAASAEQGSKPHSEESELVPYTGGVQGQLVLNLSLNLVAAPPAYAVSDLLGEGTQLYNPNDLVVVPVFWPDLGAPGMTTSGTARTVTAEGDELLLAYHLAAVFISPTDMVYTGDYTILPGGTGRFEYDDEDAENLGSGLIQGVATLAVDLSAGTQTLNFAHVFNGDLLLEPETHGHRDGKKDRKDKKDKKEKKSKPEHSEDRD